MASVKKDNPVEESRKRPAPSPAASHPSGPILTPSISNKKHSPSSAASMAATPSSITSRGNAVTEVIGGKASKGLRHFSMEVCKKVEEKGATTYNEVADELVKEYMEKQKACESSDDDDEEPIITGGKAPKKKPAKKKKKTTGYDEKNIRRRVYDALNVLMAMDIIGREKKEIRWKGLPSNAHHDLENMQRKREMKIADVHRKREELRDLIVQKVCFRNLVTRNQSKEAAGFIPRSKSSKEASHGGDGDVLEADDAIQLPFIVVNTSSKAVIQCEMSSDRSDVMFDFSLPFEINDDTMILKRLGM
jgi:transcription factor Dp-1